MQARPSSGPAFAKRRRLNSGPLFPEQSDIISLDEHPPQLASDAQASRPVPQGAAGNTHQHGQMQPCSSHSASAADQRTRSRHEPSPAHRAPSHRGLQPLHQQHNAFQPGALNDPAAGTHSAAMSSVRHTLQRPQLPDYLQAEEHAVIDLISDDDDDLTAAPTPRHLSTLPRADTHSQPLPLSPATTSMHSARTGDARQTARPAAIAREGAILADSPAAPSHSGIMSTAQHIPGADQGASREEITRQEVSRAAPETPASAMSRESDACLLLGLTSAKLASASSCACTAAEGSGQQTAHQNGSQSEVLAQLRAQALARHAAASGRTHS